MKNEYYIQRLLDEYEEFFFSEDNDIVISKEVVKKILDRLHSIFSKYYFVDKDIYAKGGKTVLKNLVLVPNKKQNCSYHIIEIEDTSIKLIIEEKKSDIYLDLNKKQIYITLLVCGEYIDESVFRLVYSKTK